MYTDSFIVELLIYTMYELHEVVITRDHDRTQSYTILVVFGV